MIQAAEPILSRREEQVLRFLADGISIKVAAYRLGISAKTAEVYRARIREKLCIDNLPGLVRYAMRHGLVAPETPLVAYEGPQLPDSNEKEWWESEQYSRKVSEVIL